jgi:hypothetical protein
LVNDTCFPMLNWLELIQNIIIIYLKIN